MKDTLETINGSSLLLPAILAVFGFFGKSLYDIYLEDRKRDRQLIESKLQNFYWPICIRLKKNENVFRYLFKGKRDSDKESIDYKISHYVEKNILMNNHEEILSIITSYRYLADADNEIGPLIDAFIKHVSIYKALLDSGINEFPGIISNAPYPSKIDDYFYEKTKALQEILDKKRI
jgi:hypothetical protein